ncbi:MAG: hypothetical protein WC055_16845 [Melioribacteraceae bacterium]
MEEKNVNLNNGILNLKINNIIIRNNKHANDSIGYLDSIMGFKFKVVENNPDEDVVRVLWQKDQKGNIYSRRSLPIEKRYLHENFFDILA